MVQLAKIELLMKKSVKLVMVDKNHLKKTGQNSEDTNIPQLYANFH